MCVPGAAPTYKIVSDNSLYYVRKYNSIKNNFLYSQCIIFYLNTQFCELIYFYSRF